MTEEERWTPFNEGFEPGGNDIGEVFVVRGNVGISYDEWATLGVWTGANFVEPTLDGEAFMGPIKGVQEYRKLGDFAC